MIRLATDWIAVNTKDVAAKTSDSKFATLRHMSDPLSAYQGVLSVLFCDCSSHRKGPLGPLVGFFLPPKISTPVKGLAMSWT